MSLILKGIDLPNCSNEDCIVVIRKNKAEVWQTGFKERTVEAIQIPKGHGRLIDADKLADDLQADGEEFGEDLKLNCASWLRSNANTTILESEG